MHGLIDPVKQGASVAAAAAAGNCDMSCIAIAVVPAGFIVAGGAVGYGVRYILPRTAQLEAIAIAIGTIPVVGSGAIGDGDSSWLTIQVPAVIRIVVGLAVVKFIARTS